jgi:hypothetical protein
MNSSIRLSSLDFKASSKTSVSFENDFESLSEPHLHDNGVDNIYASLLSSAVSDGWMGLRDLFEAREARSRVIGS